MLGLSSCEGYLDKLPLNTPSDQTFLATETEMQMALAGCYSALWLNAYFYLGKEKASSYNFRIIKLFTSYSIEVCWGFSRH